MNECLTTPQNEKQIGCWMSEKGFLLSDELLHSDICHLLISGVGVNIATDILCENVSCHCKLPVSR